MGAVLDLAMPSPTEDAVERAVLRKVTLRLIPFLCLLYFVNILDRVNIGFARLRMLDDLQMSESAYALGAGIFSIGYCLLEVPSNLLLSRVGARRWIARILVSWGAISTCMMFVNGPWSFCVLRFLLGCAEAGFFPGIVLYLSYWFPARRQARAVAMLMTASPLVWMLGGPLTGALLQFMDERCGLAGWQWVFLLEGLPAVFLGVFTLFYLTDRPEQAGWLTPSERSLLAARMAREAKQREKRHGLSFGEAAADRRVWHLVALATTIALGISGLSYYFPEFIKSRFPTLQPLEIGWMTAISGTCTLLSLAVSAFLSDRTGERRLYVVGLAFLATFGWGMSTWEDVPLASFSGIILAQAAMMSMWGPFWSLSTACLGPRAAAGGIALINAVANLGAFFGPNIMGWLLKTTGIFTAGLAVMAVVMILSAILGWCIRLGHQDEH
jgi:MFS transporter, ACS family, tartrate transporter